MTEQETKDQEKKKATRRWSFELPTGAFGSNEPFVAGDRELSEAERNIQDSNQIPLYKFVLTGGPCGGKTTGLARVYSFLKERGE